MPGPDGHNVIPVVQTIDGVVTIYYYTITGEQTIVNGGGGSTAINGVDNDLAEYSNIANAMRNMEAFEHQVSSSASASASASASL